MKQKHLSFFVARTERKTEANEMQQNTNKQRESEGEKRRILTNGLSYKASCDFFLLFQLHS